jgi:hypothetical protein
MNIEETLLTVTKYFDEKEIPYVVIGGFAAIVWGRVRTTYDIDIIIDHTKIDVRRFIQFLTSKGLSTEEYELTQAFIEQSYSTIFIMEKPFYRIDLRGIYSTEDREAISTARIVNYKGQSIYFSSPENLIAHKLKYGSDRDLEDAEVVFLAQKASLNMDYLYSLCKRLNVTEKLDQFLELNKEE